MNAAAKLASSTGGLIYSEQLLYGLTSVPNTKAFEILRALNITPELISSGMPQYGLRQNIVVAVRAKNILDNAMYVAEKFNGSVTTPEHILYAICNDTEAGARRIIVENGGVPRQISQDLLSFFRGDIPSDNSGFKTEARVIPIEVDGNSLSDMINGILGAIDSDNPDEILKKFMMNGRSQRRNAPNMEEIENRFDGDGNSDSQDGNNQSFPQYPNFRADRRRGQGGKKSKFDEIGTDLVALAQTRSYPCRDAPKSPQK